VCVSPRVLGLAVLALALLVAPIHGQSPVDDLLATCVSGGGSSTACQDGVLAYQGIQGGLGLLLTGGTDVPGGASTLGWRVPRQPRMALFTRLKGGHVGTPGILGGTQPGGTEETFLVGGLEFGAAIGAFRGFSASPTLGGILALDVLGSIQFDMLPENPGFSGNAWNWSAGAKVGLVRESFTLPGISVSVRYAGLQSVEYGNPGGGTGTAVAMDLTSRSIRAEVGKDLLAIGLLAGFGWDRYESDGGLTVPGTDGGTTGEIAVSNFTSDRTVIFGQATYTYLILQFSFEAGWATGLDPLSVPYTGAFDPQAGSGFAALSARLTF